MPQVLANTPLHHRFYILSGYDYQEVLPDYDSVRTTQSSLHALSITTGHIRWEIGGVRLIPNAVFLAKNQAESSGTVKIFYVP